MADFAEIDALLDQANAPPPETIHTANSEPSANTHFPNQQSHTDETYFGRLSSVWLTELNSPTLMPYHESLVSDINELMDYQQDLIDTKTDSGNKSMKGALEISLYQLELDRFRYLVVDYCRLRLKKIEEHVLHYMTNFQDRMSTSERKFADSYIKLIDAHYTESVLKHLPRYSDLEKLDAEGMVTVPDLNKYVFARVLNNNAEGLFAKEFVSDIVDVENATFWFGEILIARYQMLQEYVDRGEVELIG